MFLRETEDGVVIQIHVVPRSSKREIAEFQDNALKVRITSPPVEGRANEECQELFSHTFGVRKSAVTILSGHKSRKKSIVIKGVRKTDIEHVLRKFIPSL